ncbi:MAG TPA: cytochrome c4 [Gammaproteobacteria bacterium]|nr:cytochrome c4 [Gammaproteobacteria bacterium]
MKKIFIMFAVLATFLTGAATAAGNQEAGKARSRACAGCHGTDGNSAIPQNPNLAGQGAAYLVKQMKEFKSKKRDNATMFGMVAALSDQDMEDIAAYFSANKAKGGKADARLVKQGEQIYRSGAASKGLSACIGCHGPTGAGNAAARFPALSGQHSEYTVNQLKAFSTGKRSNDAGKMMQNIAGKMNSSDMQAVAAYISGLK